MGELIRFVAAHEVGHTLGLPHNMKASSAYPVDSLRAPDFVCRMGTAPSIMDYARFNYVAQPEDSVQKPILHQWILQHADNPIYRFGDPSRIDPTSQTEDLSSNQMIANTLGIKNLQRIVPNIYEWSYEEQRLIEAEARLGEDSTYTLKEMLADTRTAIWRELATGSAINTYRRNLQRGYIERMEYLMTQEPEPPPARFRAFIEYTPVDVSQSDIRAYVRSELEQLQQAIMRALRRTRDRETRLHLQDIHARIERILNPEDK